MNYIDSINYYGKNQIPFIFLIDFLAQKPLVLAFDQITDDFLFDFNGFKNFVEPPKNNKKLVFEKNPISFEIYKKKFEIVQKHILYGNSFLVNLTQATPIHTNFTLSEIFYQSQATYKLLWKDNFVFFSPESFVQIKENQVATFPMKGTIDANLPSAESIILNDSKEAAEHATIVDLLRNDLSQIAQNISVEKYRYIEKIQNNQKNLLQVSSKIIGTLPPNFRNNLGEIITKLLPAGSISGAPKKKTLDIIKEAENYERGYFTGIAGYFDGNNLDSCVMIRFIEQKNGLFFKSGGGITANSIAQNEYQELIDKVYVPIF